MCFYCRCIKNSSKYSSKLTHKVYRNEPKGICLQIIKVSEKIGYAYNNHAKIHRYGEIFKL